MNKLLFATIMAVLIVISGTAIADDAGEAPYLVMEVQIVGQDFIGLVPEGLRLDGHTSGEITEGLLVGSTTTATDYLLYRHDGVGVVDVRCVAVHPEGATVAMTLKGYLGEPMPGMLEMMLDPEFEMPEIDIPMHGAAWMQTMAPQYAFLNHTVFGFTGAMNMAEGVVRVTLRSLAP